MKREEKGFTLIEVVLSLVLFALLLEGLWHFFGTTYLNYIHFEKKAETIDNARALSDFIRDEIRISDKVSIEVNQGESLGAAVISSENEEYIEGILKVIYLETADTETSTDKTKRTIELEKISHPTHEQGKYKLVYKKQGLSQRLLVSDQIESIKVTQEKNSPNVTFECLLHKKDETVASQKVNSIFTESLKYKSKYD